VIRADIELAFHLTGATFVNADRGQLEQVIMNLTVNARDAMPNGGTLTIEVDRATPPATADGRSGPHVRLSMRDTGVGMTEEVRARIFEPFFTTKERGKGTGLGLATVYGIVKQHEGWIEVASEVGRGTTFSVYLPSSDRSTAATASALGTAEATESAGGNECVLIVEDEPELREMAVMILESFGYHHLLAGSGPEALTVWNAHSGSIDLVLTDMVMPGGMTGRDLAKQLISERPGLPVVIASGYSIDDISNELSGNMNISFVQKPYNLDALARAIRNALDAAKKP
jgi:CheY-like chemotaxis protein